MAGIIEKIKNFFSSMCICKVKKEKEEPKLQQEEPKVEEKPEEQK
ncbi:MAG: hypothetical protein Q7J67_01545 [bacterium]|nr:hypothetical protein [bacterium]